MKLKFNVGDIVRVVKKVEYCNQGMLDTFGKEFKIKKIGFSISHNNPYGLEVPGANGIHGCWWCGESDIELVNNSIGRSIIRKVYGIGG